MEIPKSSGVGGSWLDKKSLKNGDVVKLTTEALFVEGQNGKQLVAKCKVKGQTGEFNLSINTPSKNALIEAYGSDSKDWVDKILTVSVESGIFAGKRGIMLNLVPEGFEVGEDDNGYITISKPGASNEYPSVDVDPDDIPF